MSSVSFGVFLSMNGVLGPVCGTHNNFTMAIMNVIDNKDTWGGIFPLGLALIGNSSYPLTVQSVLDECRQNHSLYVSLQLVERLDLDAISFSEMVRELARFLRGGGGLSWYRIQASTNLF